MNFLRSAIDDGNGNASSVRLLLLYGVSLIVTTVCGLEVYSFVVDHKFQEVPTSLATLLGSFLGFLSALKYMSGITENQLPTTSKQTTSVQTTSTKQTDSA